ncbi:hypothetical protein [Bosea sp. (in: a-proteobacteria)]|uniref:hypothetical protein n=1 Tax=Bosea sp. (in: a-proteobacteria) TaxID=1871050 RepID=UPI003B3A3B6D
MSTGEISAARPGADGDRLARFPAAGPSLTILGFAGMAGLALALPLALPLGPNAWDSVAYLDAIHRIRSGQTPGLDFFAPVGPLGYYLAAALARLFPHAQPALLANWALLPVLLPALLLLMADLAPRRPRQAWALLLPFLLFAALPINLHALYASPGFDGYGHYNRQVVLLLYLLVATLLFTQRRALRIGLVAGLMLVLFLTKITGAVTGTMLVGYALLVGRLTLVEVAAAAAITILALLGLELSTGLIFAYLADILELLGLNTGGMLPRILTLASVKFNVLAPLLALLGVLGFAAWRQGLPRSLAGLRTAADAPVGWLAVGLVALALFETQNSGSLEFVALWPVLLLLLGHWWRQRDNPLRTLVLVLIMLVALPSPLIYVERGMRAVLAAPTYRTLDLPELGPLGQVSAKPDLIARARTMLDHYGANPQAYRDLVARGLSPSHFLSTEIDYQATWLMEVQQGLRAITAWEAANRRRLNRVFTLDFVDPMNALLGRVPPRGVPVGADPTRTLPRLDADTMAELAATDAILAPQCPPTPDREALRRHFQPALEGRERIALAPCWDMYLRKRP